ncbi:MAG: KH domain-containing protein [Deltaproteobacteria bacterium]|nr:KH domain-containing protein [Deltaproteobacteria bacterium]
MSKELVEYIAKALVDNPDKVLVDEVKDERGAILNLSVDKSDLGKVIGKNGKTAKAIRAILSVASTKTDSHNLLKIME